MFQTVAHNWIFLYSLLLSRLGFYLKKEIQKSTISQKKATIRSAPGHEVYIINIINI